VSRVNLIPVGYAGDAFHIGSNENFHIILPPLLFLEVVGNVDYDALET
jgi:hypothetical protein